MKLYIDGLQADTDENWGITVSLSLDGASQSEQQIRGREGRCVSIPMTPRNREIMGYAEEVNAAERFNDRIHTARIESQGCTIGEGTVNLNECLLQPGGGRYVLDIAAPSSGWVRHASENNLDTLFPDMRINLTASGISEGWMANRAVCMFPVQREEKPEITPTHDKVVPAREFTVDDYHPFIRLGAVITGIFAEAGYEICSDFMDTAFFRSIFMSGNFRKNDTDRLRKKMDFRAGRFAATQAAADRMGRVYADPYSNYNTVGNIVETSDPFAEMNGKTVPGVFDNGGCFGLEGRRIVFRPKSEVTLAFRYKLRYVTDYRIKNADELAGFDVFRTEDLRVHSVTLPNGFKDRKNEFAANWQLRCIVTDHIQGRRYRLVGLRMRDTGDPAPGDYQAVTVGEFSSRSAVVSTSVEGKYAGVELYYGNSPGAIDTPYTGQWMLYDGYVGETGQVEVEVEFTSAPRTFAPGAPAYFDTVYFGGAEEEMQLVLKECNVEPVFQPHPVLGSEAAFADIAAHGISRLKVIEATAHMFNLCFYTNHISRKVYIEPHPDFHSGPVVDWSGRIDFTNPVVMEELGTGAFRKITYRYLEGDEAVSRFETADGSILGEWSAEIRNPHAPAGEKVFVNPLFGPSVNAAGYVASAPSALLPSVRPDDEGVPANDAYRNFSPRIVRYGGMVSLPEGERWSWPSYGRQYPSVAFHDARAADNRTLCFEDRDGLAGLHRYRDMDMEDCNTGRRLRIRMAPGPEDMEAVMYPNRLKKDFRGRFLLRIAGETGLWRLEQINRYDPGTSSAECVFVKNTGLP